MEKIIKLLKEEVSKLRGYAVIIDGEDGEWEPVTTVSMEDIYEILNQLDEPEVLLPEVSLDVILDDLKEYVKEQQSLSSNVGMAHTPAGNDTHYRQYEFVLECIGEYEPSEELKELVPKQDEREQLEIAYKDILERGEFWFDDKEYVVVEKPVIPQFVADFISDKEDWTVSELFDDEWLYKEHDQIAKWLYDNDDTVNRQREADLVFAKQNGFTVEEEQKYYVMNNDNRVMLVRMMDGKTITEADPFKLEDMYEAEKKSHRLTEQEIKDYDPRYWAFRKPVEEME